MSSTNPTRTPLATTLRRAVLALCILGSVGTMVELAVIGHWESFEQVIPWIVLSVLAAAAIAVWVRPGNRRLIGAVRILALVAVASSAFGLWEHIDSNYESGPLDATYGKKWDSMSEGSRWWAAMMNDVGSAPLLAPGSLAQTSLCLLAGTIGLGGRREGEDANDVASPVSGT